jgi:hypothetical protein
MRRSNVDVADQVTALASWPREELTAQWQKAYGSPPPKGIRQELLVRSAAWHLQARHFGALSPATRRALKAAIAEAERGMAKPPSPSTSDGDLGASADVSVQRHRMPISPGARLLRDWNGKTHVVDVIEDGLFSRPRSTGLSPPSLARSPAHIGQVRGSSGYDR